MAIAAVISGLVSAQTTPRLTLTFKDAAKQSGLSESYLRFLASERGECKLVTTKVGRKRLVSYESLQNLVK